MEKRNAVLWGYFVKNLGDDLMLKAFVDKNKNRYHKIYINSYRKFKPYYSEMGIKVIAVDSFWYRAVNKIFSTLKLPELYYRIAGEGADFIMLGGSLFAETSSASDENQISNLKYAVDHAENSYIVGSNFGPYHSRSFFEAYEKIFEKCKDICFRDRYSYEMFLGLEIVRYAPDIVLAGTWEERNKENHDSPAVVISVIDLERRAELKDKRVKYEEMIVSIIQYHIQKNDKVILAAFCEFEGDVEACMRIWKLCGENTNVEIKAYQEFGFLNVLSNAKRIYGARFHSIILAMYYGIPCVPFIYGKKTYYALCSYSKSFQTVRIKELEEYSLEKILDACKIIEVFPEVKKLAGGQFEGGD